VAAVSSTYVSTWAQFGSQTAALIDSFGAWPTNDQQWDDDPTRVSAGVGMWVQMRGMSLALMKDYYPGDTQVQNAWTTFETLAEDMPAMQAVGFEYPQNGMRRNVVPVGYTRP